MSFIVTEFPIKSDFTKEIFIGKVLEWLRGMVKSEILDTSSEHNLYGEAADFTAPSGETLRLREIENNGILSVGFKHEIPDDEGHIWRTEAIARIDPSKYEVSLISVKSQCVALERNVKLHYPKKSFFIKSILKDDFGEYDGNLPVTDVPIYLDENLDFHTALEIITGSATEYLPVIYISSAAKGENAFKPKEIDDLAYQLGGIAHVVVEPNRDFSFKLRDQSEGQNVYGGAVGLFLPHRGLLKKFFIGWQFNGQRGLIQNIIFEVNKIRSAMPKLGWEWSDLQEQVLSSQFNTQKDEENSEAILELYREDIKELKQENEALKEERILRNSDENSSGNFIGIVNNKFGKEIYQNEIIDRLKFAIIFTLKNADDEFLDNRTKSLFLFLNKEFKTSQALRELLNDLKRATRDKKSLDKHLEKLLSRHGYWKKSTNNHTKYEPLEGFCGLQAINSPNTPSDKRSLKNLESQIQSHMGLKTLKDIAK